MRRANEREQTRYQSNLAQVDAHVITPEEYEETTETNLSRAEFAITGVVQPHPRQQNHSPPSRGSRHPEPFPRSAVLLSGRRSGLAGPRGWALREWIAAH